MPICAGPCGLDKPRSEFRTKHTVQWPNFTFPKCIACEQDEHHDKVADDLRAKGYVVSKQASTGGGSK